jgi:hypothetical protein
VVIDFGAVEETQAEGARPPAASRGVMRSAEITTSARGPAAPSAPAPGPSILLDPRLMAEMDALERSNQPPAPAPAAPPAPRPAPPPAGAAVVSFVHQRPGAAAAPISSSAPTIPVAPSAPVAARRASSEFDAVEKDFFAREPEPEEGESADATADNTPLPPEADLDAGSDPGQRDR